MAINVNEIEKNIDELKSKVLSINELLESLQRISSQIETTFQAMNETNLEKIKINNIETVIKNEIDSIKTTIINSELEVSQKHEVLYSRTVTLCEELRVIINDTKEILSNTNSMVKSGVGDISLSFSEFSKSQSQNMNTVKFAMFGVLLMSIVSIILAIII